MNDKTKTKTELVMENVHLRRKLAEAEQRARHVAQLRDFAVEDADDLRCELESAEDAVRRRDAELADLRKRDFSALTEGEMRVLEMWPRFEDNEPVMHGDEFWRGGAAHTAHGFQFGSHTVSICVEGAHENLMPNERIKRPASEVLDADGVPIKVGELLYGIGCAGHEFKVLGLLSVDDKFGDAFPVKCHDIDDGGLCYCKPELLTHREPDSWERMERDATMNPFSYCAMRGIETEVEDGEMEPTNEAFALDLIRRAKALAGIEVER